MLVISLIRYNVEFHWDTKKIMDRHRCLPCRPVDRWFQVKDVGVNSVYAAGWTVLQQLALSINDTATADLCGAEAATSTRAIISKMHVPALNGFRSLYVDWDGQEKISTPNVIQNLFPLLLPLLPRDLVENLAKEVQKKSLCRAERMQHVLCMCQRVQQTCRTSRCAFMVSAGRQQQQIQQHVCAAHCGA